MTAVETLRIEPASLEVQDFVGIGVPLSPKEEFRRWRLASAERQEREGLTDETPLTMEEIVAIVKEVRAERYAEKQKNSTCH